MTQNSIDPEKESEGKTTLEKVAGSFVALKEAIVKSEKLLEEILKNQRKKA